MVIEGSMRWSRKRSNADDEQDEEHKTKAYQWSPTCDRVRRPARRSPPSSSCLLWVLQADTPTCAYQKSNPPIPQVIRVRIINVVLFRTLFRAKTVHSLKGKLTFVNLQNSPFVDRAFVKFSKLTRYSSSCASWHPNDHKFQGWTVFW